MNIKPYFRILLKKLWIIVSIPLLAAVVTAVVSFFLIQPVYESSMTVYAFNKGSDKGLVYDDILTSQQLIKDYRELIKSRSMAKAVIEQLDLEGLSVDKLTGMITVNLKNDTRILEIKVKDKDNVRAKAIIDKIGTLFEEKAKNMMMIENLNVVDAAEIPSKPVSPRPLANMLIAFLVALLLVIGVVFLLEYMDDTFKKSEDVEKYLGFKVLAAIPSLDME